MANPVVDDERNGSNQGAATPSNWRFETLWYADSEGESIQAVYPETDIFKRRDATIATLEKEYPNHQILHFATHAFVDTVFDAFSGLILAPGSDSTDDGMLMGFEISDHHFNCELVTMSACETGLGKHVAGEGVLSLPRLFMGAGAGQVLMTLWKVGDEYSLALMPKFYDNFLNLGQTKAEALREAKQAMFEKSDKGIFYQHPFYWAAFALYGEPDFPRRDEVMQWILLIALFAVLMALSIYLLRRKRTM
jgi:CHAT domain-containing protein